MGEAKRRKDLGLPPRMKELLIPKFDKKKVKSKVKEILYKYPLIPFTFYALAIVIFLTGIYFVITFYK